MSLTAGARELGLKCQEPVVRRVRFTLVFGSGEGSEGGGGGGRGG